MVKSIVFRYRRMADTVYLYQLLERSPYRISQARAAAGVDTCKGYIRGVSLQPIQTLRCAPASVG